jgi:hypothetical protein
LQPDITGALLHKRQLTIRYVIFYILFLPDSWQVLAGAIAAYFLAPHIELPTTGFGAGVMAYIMIAVIGYAATRVPAQWVTRNLVKWMLGDKRS